jgi:putative ABC transport system ATP-binding protein
MVRAPDIFLQGNHISKQFQSGERTITILKDINLSIMRGESVAILGASGSGKTTLLTLLSGLDLPTSGDIYLDGIDLNKLNEEQRAAIRAQGVGFIFQSFLLLPSLTALENVMLPLELKFILSKEAKERALHGLNEVGLNDRVHHYPAQLSGGEQQRVAIARAFVTRPKVIFADEMTGNLDNETGEKIKEILFSLNQQNNTTLILVTHDEKIAEVCTRKLQLYKGELQPC